MAPQLIADSYLLQCVASAVLSSILYSKRSFPLACFHSIPLEKLKKSNQDHFLLKIIDEEPPFQEYIPLSTFNNDEVIISDSMTATFGSNSSSRIYLSDDEEDKELGKLQLFLSSRPLLGPNCPEYLGVTVAGEITPEEVRQLEKWEFYGQQLQPAWEERRIALLRVIDVEDDSSSETIASEKETTPDSPKVPRRSNRLAGRPPDGLPETKPVNPVPQSAPTSRKRKAQGTPLEEPLMKLAVVLPTAEQVKAQNRLLPQKKSLLHHVGASSIEEPCTGIPDALSARKLPVNPLTPDSNDPGWTSDDFS